MLNLGPWPGIEPGPPALGVWSLNHWTSKEVPPCHSSSWSSQPPNNKTTLPLCTRPCKSDSQSWAGRTGVIRGPGKASARKWHLKNEPGLSHCDELRLCVPKVISSRKATRTPLAITAPCLVLHQQAGNTCHILTLGSRHWCWTSVSGQWNVSFLEETIYYSFL